MGNSTSKRATVVSSLASAKASKGAPLAAAATVPATKMKAMGGSSHTLQDEAKKAAEPKVKMDFAGNSAASKKDKGVSTSAVASTGVKEYSWDKRPARDPNDFMISNRIGETMFKAPGSIGGEQFQIDNCANCCIYVLDNTATVTIDKCTSCTIFLAPIKTRCFPRYFFSFSSVLFSFS